MKLKKIINLPLLAMLFLSLLFASCEKDADAISISNPKNELSFEYQLSNTEDKTYYKLSSSEVVRKRSEWFEIGEGFGVNIQKSIVFDVKLANGVEMLVELGHRGTEKNKELLILEDEEKDYWERAWDYRSTALEINNFWSRPQRYITIGNLYMWSYSRFEVTKTQKVVVNGVEKTWVEIRFSGEASCAYCAYQNPDMIIKNGLFRGVIE